MRRLTVRSPGRSPAASSIAEAAILGLARLPSAAAADTSAS
jgi:hypothetical protein